MIWTALRRIEHKGSGKRTTQIEKAEEKDERRSGTDDGDLLTLERDGRVPVGAVKHGTLERLPTLDLGPDPLAARRKERVVSPLLGLSEAQRRWRLT